jgi:CubicO group peptidase (beta-lactamase class C family)
MRVASRVRCLIAACGITVWSCAPVLIAQSPSQTPQTLTTNTASQTSKGVTFTAPASWSLSTKGAATILEAPEGDTRLVLVDAGTAPSADAALEAAWTAYNPARKRPIKLSTPRPSRNGWDESVVFSFETSPNERATVQAIVHRAGDQWTVLLLDGTDMTVEKRGSQLGLVLQSARRSGYSRETFAGRKAMSLNPERIDQMKSFVEASMKKLGIPGAAIAFIDGGQIVYEGGIGVKELGKPTPVDANTLFMAASNTKGMATLLLSIMADEKKLRWDQPVTEIYPGFKLGDEATTKQVLVKHLVCACTGLPRQDLEWLFEFKNATPASSMQLLGTMKPTSKFGEVYQYSNLMAAAAGYVGGYLYNPKLDLGTAFDEAMQKRIFNPLGMTSTTFDFKKVLAGNYASPHALDVDAKPALGSMANNYSIVAHRPAGGVWTSAHDLIRYVQLELAKGKLPNGKQLVSEENLLARRQPQVSSGEDVWYGMGLSVNKRWGIPVVSHGGSMFGYKSDIVFLPEHNIGAVLLTNSDTGGSLLRPFMRRLLEVVFDGRPEAAGDVDTAAATTQAAYAKERKRLVIPADPAEVSKLANRYRSPELGELIVRRDKSSVVFDFGEWRSAVATRKNDDGTISFLTSSPGTIGFEFVLGERDGKRVLITRDAQHEYVFGEV